MLTAHEGNDTVNTKNKYGPRIIIHLCGKTFRNRKKNVGHILLRN